MKRLLALFAVTLALALGGSAWADDTAAPAADAAPAAAAPAEAAPAAPAAAPAAAEAAAPSVAAAPAPAPVPNKGDIAWMIVATLLVVMMAAPGLGMYYGGMARSKNMLSVLMQTLLIFCLLGVLWALYGYSIAFTEGSSFFGGFGKAFL